MLVSFRGVEVSYSIVVRKSNLRRGWCWLMKIELKRSGWLEAEQVKRQGAILPREGKNEKKFLLERVGIEIRDDINTFFFDQCTLAGRLRPAGNQTSNTTLDVEDGAPASN